MAVLALVTRVGTVCIGVGIIVTFVFGGLATRATECCKYIAQNIAYEGFTS